MGKTTKAIKKPKVTKPRTKKKVQTGPKKPKSGFMFYSQDRRKTLKDEQPGLAITDASKVIGAEWRKLTDEEKRPYDESASKDRERYKKEKQDIADKDLHSLNHSTVVDAQEKSNKWLTRNKLETGDINTLRQLRQPRHQIEAYQTTENYNVPSTYKDQQSAKDQTRIIQPRSEVTDITLNRPIEPRQTSTDSVQYRESAPQSSQRKLDSSYSYSKDSTFKRNAARFFSDSRHQTPQTNAKEFNRNAEIFFRNTQAVSFRDNSTAKPISEKPVQTRPAVATNSDQFVKNAKLFYGYESSCNSAANSLPASAHSIASIRSIGSMNTEMRVNLSKFYDGKPSTSDAYKLNTAAFYRDPTPVEPLNMRISRLPPRDAKTPLDPSNLQYRKNHARFFGSTPPQSSGSGNSLQFSAKKFFDS